MIDTTVILGYTSCVKQNKNAECHEPRGWGGEDEETTTGQKRATGHKDTVRPPKAVLNDIKSYKSKGCLSHTIYID